MENKPTNHPLVDTDKFICDICGEEFDSVSKLEEHKLRHGRPGRAHEDTERVNRGDIGAAGMPQPTLFPDILPND